MADLSANLRLAVLLFLFRQIYGVVIPVPDEMVPENLMFRDPDSESGFSIDQDVLNQLLKQVTSSSIVQRTNMEDNQDKYREDNNEEEGNQDNQEENAEETVRHQAEKSTYHKQRTMQMSKNEYSTSPRENIRLNEQRTQGHTPIREYVDSGKETYQPKSPQDIHQNAMFQRQNAPSNPVQSAGVERQTISGQYPFTEFSPNAYDQSKQRRITSSKQYYIQDSSVANQQRNDQRKSTIQPHFETSPHSGNQPTQDILAAQQEQAQREQPSVDYRQYPTELRQPFQVPSHTLQPPQKLQIGNISVRRTATS